MSTDSEGRALRSFVYVLLIVVVAGSVGARILAVTRFYEPYLYKGPDGSNPFRSTWPSVRPKPQATLQGNDRSRWCTVRALVDEGTYVIGHRDAAHITERNKYGDYGICRDDGWETLDMVMKPGTSDFYSSKPPLLPTMLAGEYWVLKKMFGWSITDSRGQIVRTILFTVNWLPLLIYLVLLARLVEKLGVSSWGRLFLFTAGCFATFQIPFAIALNNHGIACATALFTLYLAWPYAFRDSWSWSKEGTLADGSEEGTEPNYGPIRLAAAGLFAGLTACNELPAASFTGALLAIMLVKRFRETLYFFVPALALAVAAFFITNYLALGRLTPAYAEAGSNEAGLWYHFPGSWWNVELGQVKHGIDFAWMKETKAEYAFNLIIGHHGLFSLSPIFFLSLIGIAMTLGGYLRQREKADMVGTPGLVNRFRQLPGTVLFAGFSLVLTVTVLAFYVVKSNNYGGWTCGPRWLMWLTPLLLLTMVPCLDWVARFRTGRVACYVLLGFSVLSVSYAFWSPWRHPWIYDLLEALGRIQY